MTSGSAMHAMIRTARPQDEQILESMPQICFERQVYVRLRALIHPRRLAAQGRALPIAVSCRPLWKALHKGRLGSPLNRSISMANSLDHVPRRADDRTFAEAWVATPGVARLQ
jgi:hypothetical protein